MLCTHQQKQCRSPALPCQFFWCVPDNGSDLIPPEPRFVEQGRGTCEDSNGNRFSRITYGDAEDLDECKAKCSATGFESNLVGLDYKASGNYHTCNCYFDNGLQFTNSSPGYGNCPSDAHAWWSVDRSCANALTPTIGGVAEAACCSRAACLKNDRGIIPRFVEQGRGTCEDSNGNAFTRITYDAGDLDECKAKCSATGFESSLVGLDYNASSNSCSCRFDNGLQFTSQSPGSGNCPSDANAYWSVGSSCANSPASTIGGVTGAGNQIGFVCLKNDRLITPPTHFDQCKPPSFGED